jgi:hypothetical protein
MSTPYKKIKLANGGKMDNTIDNVGVGVASAFGPWWGALAKGGVEASKKIAGDGMNENKNMLAYEVDPFKHIKSIGAGFKDPKRFLETIPIYGTMQAGKRMKREAVAKKAEAERAAKVIPTQGELMAFDKANLQNPGFKKGGVMPGSRSIVRGGELTPIGDGAVKVKADAPSKTDSVELEKAFVDHNEVIKDNKVFSDKVKLGDGKSVAKSAEDAIKSKTNVPQKLDSLFRRQQSKSIKKTVPIQMKNPGVSRSKTSTTKAIVKKLAGKMPSRTINRDGGTNNGESW